MKNIKKYTVFTFIVFLSSIYSCTDILDQEPLNITHPNVFWDSQPNAEQALAGSYSLFKYAMTVQASFIFWGELPGMTFMNSRNWIANYVEGSGNYVLPYRGYSRDWKYFYRAANWALTIEKYVEDMPDDLFTSKEEKDRIIGEAAFVRGLSYYWMARIWGDVPIITESVESSSQLLGEDGYIVRVPRSNELEVLDHALEATNKAIGLLQYSSPGSPTWAITANKASAEALKAGLTLWYASRDNGNTEMIQQSIDAATSVINNSGAELIDYVNEGKDGFDAMCIGQSKTGLFEINMSAAMNESFRMSNSDSYYTGLTLNAPIWKNENTNVAPTIDPDFYGKQMMNEDPDRENDVRKELFFYDYESSTNSFPLKYSHSSPDPNSEDNYALFSESNILLFRMADMYLLRAEAYARSGNAGLAVADLNMVRSKANVPDYMGDTDKETLMKVIFDERAIEFVGEGKSAYDRIRMEYYEGVPWMNQSRIAKKGYFWPVDPSIISNNPSIVQTEYWRGAL
ncbi:RagB/SusD family nutrient uptake outer membrane protein [Aureibaculum sp. 2210JD6-5]|uniref:RagB/SusD family nutrient uptake outer membrane protein n=1 Tax=Aureibaculum sp. 2210JD6-5 TaxID=3103957 RepID=UPI002AAC8241|nr:RagB/SusD family nutrient uptake outer membrane protein [Aureibaculum sp. 2210JD6-5]MDY7394599.1 RagB/SusD family nutrient uptake outer membrane protein [Aureibaculum sp. 2210JD6-5]